jgi:peptide-methionine (S)-S-oxide reductase
MATETVTLGGGCFWCLQPVYKSLKGVGRVECGYSGGDVVHPSYEEVSTGNTGHAEVVQVEFDPALITFDEILEVFFAVHDPTTLNRQGGDVGPQYRSVVFFHTPEQKAAAEKMIETLGSDGSFKDPIVTFVSPFRAFHPAEDSHQDYYEKHPYRGYCVAVISPKLKKFRKRFAGKFEA